MRIGAGVGRTRSPIKQITTSDGGEGDGDLGERSGAAAAEPGGTRCCEEEDDGRS